MTLQLLTSTNTAVFFFAESIMSKSRKQRNARKKNICWHILLFVFLSHVCQVFSRIDSCAFFCFSRS